MSIMQRLLKLRRKLGEQVIIAAHHYQAEEITGIADIVGDSYRLAVDVSASDAEFIIFCGVHFMAEGASVLAKPSQKVLMPDPSAGCPMADMITLEQAEHALKVISSSSSREIVPVVYMNAHAGLKAFCGTRGGSVCTSSNAKKILTYYISRGKGVFFFPDQHLGRNTAFALGLDRGEVILANDPFLEAPAGDKTVYLWDGCCPVHQEFSVSQISSLRSRYPGITVIVHPEVNDETAASSDMTGSTEYIYKAVHESPPGSFWAVGTEQRFVERLAHECRDKTIVPLKPSPCDDMGKTTPELLLETLESVKSSTYADRVITVSEEVRSGAAQALSRMILLAEGGKEDG